MEPKLFYRVGNTETQQGLWYDFNGKFTGLIHSRFNFCTNNQLPMPFDNRLIGWLSATETLEELFQWFTVKDINRLEPFGFRIAIYIALDYKQHQNHWVINQKTSVLSHYIPIQDAVLQVPSMRFPRYMYCWNDDIQTAQKVKVIYQRDENESKYFHQRFICISERLALTSFKNAMEIEEYEKRGKKSQILFYNGTELLPFKLIGDQKKQYLISDFSSKEFPVKTVKGGQIKENYIGTLLSYCEIMKDMPNTMYSITFTSANGISISFNYTHSKASAI